MITCNLMGGLGNQLFQIFATIAYAIDNKSSFVFLQTDSIGKRPVYSVRNCEYNIPEIIIKNGNQTIQVQVGTMDALFPNGVPLTYLPLIKNDGKKEFAQNILPRLRKNKFTNFSNLFNLIISIITDQSITT